jgi:hypothetical protein
MGKGWFKTVLKAAKSSYHKKGGADEPSPPPPVTETETGTGTGTESSNDSVTKAMGGRRRKTHKKRRHH